MTKRRDFIARMSVAAAAMAIDADELRAASRANVSSSKWDTSWIDRVESAKFRVVFNASDISDGAAMNYADTFFGDYHEVHGTSDKDTRPVIVFRRLGTPMAFNNAMWDKYSLGEDTKVTDETTKAPAKRNVFWTGKSWSIDALQARGMVSLVCNIATENWGRGIAQKRSLPVEEVQKDLKANLVPGAILVPSGIFALIRAQNAGCAYMPGT
jgi:intracellular sulfur oxidation DsrE/DsrF family protein